MQTICVRAVGCRLCRRCRWRELAHMHTQHTHTHSLYMPSVLFVRLYDFVWYAFRTEFADRTINLICNKHIHVYDTLHTSLRKECIVSTHTLLAGFYTLLLCFFSRWVARLVFSFAQYAMIINLGTHVHEGMRVQWSICLCQPSSANNTHNAHIHRSLTLSLFLFCTNTI